MTAVDDFDTGGVNAETETSAMMQTPIKVPKKTKCVNFVRQEIEQFS